jgi:hypothetical protein
MNTTNKAGNFKDPSPTNYYTLKYTKGFGLLLDFAV